nr:MAG TPA: hypothetical protein [Bacteriophage sp.]
MTAEEFLKNDNSYLVVPHKTTNIFSKAFWEKADNKNLDHKFAGSKGNQREAYEAGVKMGWQEATRTLKSSLKVPNNVNLTDKEYKDIIALLNAFGYQFTYINPNPYMGNTGNLVPGLNICKNMSAIEAGVVLSEGAKQEIIKTLKEKADPRLFS